jgi:hypothetical protein
VRLRSSSASPLASPAVVWGGYGAGILAIGAGLLVRRRRSIDPVRARLHQEMRLLRGHVASDRSAKSVADALRRMAALAVGDGAAPEELDDVLRSLDEAAFAPGGAGAAVGDAVRKQALSVADRMMERVG